MTALAEDLASGIEQLGLTVTLEIQQKMLDYLDLMQKWNKVYNLTAIRNPEQMVSNHLLDSLAVLPHLWQGKWLDVGCGAGLPGIVLALMRPQWRFTLLDSNSKKISFVRQAIIELKLSNIDVCCDRVEKWQAGEKFDGIISRAFAETSDFIALTRHLLAQGGRWAVMKGVLETGLDLIPQDVKIERLIPLQVPGLEAARGLVILKAS